MSVSISTSCWMAHARSRRTRGSYDRRRQVPHRPRHGEAVRELKRKAYHATPGGRLKPDNLPASGRQLALVGASASDQLPAIFLRSESAGKRFWEFFTANIRNRNTRRAYFVAVAQFSEWCEAEETSRSRTSSPIHVAGIYRAARAAIIPSRPSSSTWPPSACCSTGSSPARSCRPIPAHAVRGPKHSVKKGKTSVLSAEEMGAAARSIASTAGNARSASAIARSSRSWATPSPASARPSP